MRSAILVWLAVAVTVNVEVDELIPAVVAFELLEDGIPVARGNVVAKEVSPGIETIWEKLATVFKPVGD